MLNPFNSPPQMYLMVSGAFGVPRSGIGLGFCCCHRFGWDMLAMHHSVGCGLKARI